MPVAGPVLPEVVANGLRSEKRIALTFDACSVRKVANPFDERIVRILEQTQTPATLFLGGKWARRQFTSLRQMAQNPLFEMANHSFNHPHLTRATETAIRAELLQAQTEIFAATGRLPTLFRPPYGEYDEKLVRVAASVGLTTVEYDLPSGDPDDHATKDRLVRYVLLKARPGSIVVMHMNHPKFHTAEALPDIIRGLRARGYTLVTVGELIRASREERARPNCSMPTTPWQPSSSGVGLELDDDWSATAPDPGEKDEGDEGDRPVLPEDTVAWLARAPTTFPVGPASGRRRFRPVFRYE